MHGYLSSTLSFSTDGSAQASAAATASTRINRFTLAYGTETGNAKKLATKLAKGAKERGFQVKLAALDQYRLKDLPKEEYFFLIVSTQGDGEPPAAALPFFDYIKQADVSLSKLHFGILGLGDTAYPLFCQAGIDADNLLVERGGQRVLPLVKCDQVYDEEGAKWLDDITKALEGSPQTPASVAPPASPAATGRELYTGEVITNINLNDAPSAKETHHIEIRCEEDIAYSAGDAAGFVPENPKELVDRVLELLGKTGEETVTFRDSTESLRDAFTKKANLTFLPARVTKKYAALTGQTIGEQRFNFDELLSVHPLGNVELSALLEIMEPITPRLYSISSSPLAHPGELHLTVARNSFVTAGGAPGEGLCSTFLNRLPEEVNVQFYIHKNHAFKLPSPETDIIMVGPGTGIAPFRSFLFERDASSATGRNWLFFGEQHFVTDFLYQTELQDFLKTGVLHRLDVAFSRDQKEKIYVQHRLLENGAELFEWLEKGAAFFVCGTKDPMSIDVERTLLQIIRDHGKLDEEKAREYLDRLAEERRYAKDVY